MTVTDRMRPVVAATLALACATPAAASAQTKAHVRLTTSTLVHGDQILAGDGSVVSRRRLVQRLGLLVRPAEPTPWTFHADLRLATDAGLDQPGARPAGLEARSVDLRHATLEGRGLWGGLTDVTLGRQYRWDTSDLLAFDGVRTLVHGPLGLGVEMFGGLIVRRDASWLGSSDLDPDGRVTTSEQTPTVGARLSLDGGTLGRGSAGWRRAWRSGDTVRELITAAVTFGPRWGLRPDARVLYDMHLQRTERLGAGLSWGLPGGLGLETESRVERVRPSFDADSIWPYFSGGASDNAWGALRWRSVAGATAWLRGGRRWFSEGEEADETALGAGAPVGRAAFARASLRRRAGYGGDWTSAMLAGAWTPGGSGGLELDGRVRWSRFEADLLERLTGDSVQLVAGAAFPLTPPAQIHVTVEGHFTPLAAPSLRAFAVLDLGFVL